jgi:O-antigen/teichoic acid export membrane protein
VSDATSPRDPAPGAAAPAQRRLRAAALRASGWVAGGYAAGQLLRFVGNLVLARLLFPEVFGLGALVTVLLQGLQMFSDVGTGPAIVRSARGDDVRFLDTAFTVASVRGVVLWLAACALARPAAAFYGEPLLAQVLPVAGLAAVMGGLEATSLRAAQRHLRAERVAAVELAAQFVTIASNVVLVLAWRARHPVVDLGAIWAVVAGGLLGSATRLVLSHVALPGPRNRFRLEPESLRLLLGFGRWIFVSTVLAFLAGQSDRLLLGKMIPLDLLGVYGIALALAQLAAQGVNKLGSLVLFPAYSRLELEGRLGRTFVRGRLPLLVLGGTVASGLIACGEPLVAFLYDRRYAQAGWILQLLAAGAWLQVLDATYAAALLAQGRVGWMAASSAAKLGGIVALVPLGMHLGGFAGALAGLVLSDLLKYAVSAAAMAAARVRGLGHDLALSAAVAAVAYGALAAPGAGGAAATRLAVPALVVVAAWGAVGIWALRRARSDAPPAPERSAPAA